VVEKSGAVLVEELVELLVIDAMRALHLAITEWHGRVLVARAVDLQGANPGAIVDSRELI